MPVTLALHYTENCTTRILILMESRTRRDTAMTANYQSQDREQRKWTNLVTVTDSLAVLDGLCLVTSDNEIRLVYVKRFNLIPAKSVSGHMQVCMQTRNKYTTTDISKTD